MTCTTLVFQVVPRTPQANLSDMPRLVNGGQGNHFQGTSNGIWSVALKGERKVDLKISKEWCTFQLNRDAPFIIPKFIPAFMEIGRERELGWCNPHLNKHQKAAVWHILQGLARPSPYIIFGPPGTGKTVTVVEAIIQLHCGLPFSRILVTTPSNSSADLIVERLAKSGACHPGEMVRLSAFQRDPALISSIVKPFSRSADDLARVVRSRIIVTTCASSGLLYSQEIRRGHFTHVIIDEAGQAMEPEALIPIGLVSPENGQIILAGDPLQLGPVLTSSYAKTYGLGLSLLERLCARVPYSRNEIRFQDHGSYDPLLVTKLVKNYRSHDAILNFYSSAFYAGELEVEADRNIRESLCHLPFLPCPGIPIIFHGVHGENLQEEASPSWFNPAEVFQVIRYLQKLDQSGLCENDVGVVTPYRKQVEKIRSLMKRFGLPPYKVGSVEEFQGQERKAIIISTVRSCEEFLPFDLSHNMGFLFSKKRFNVAISRAKALLIVIGDPWLLSTDNYWRQLLDKCIHLGVYCGCTFNLPSP
ncbi:unnamed protein product [Darwinula stevensoni]|uniref:RNA helicase n=1 Tax=Darwinula stevensoni TaxID=69355 RepID=A0A7R9FQP6_9CRUS|nr:unnamed protein product [Darwinula stevensoni]CAG0899830.1 unnamed protein product [Darwinula stevensoni]